MSVINRMLQELESRHEQPQAKLPGMVRAVPPPRRDYRRVLALGALLLAAVLGAGGVWLWRRESAPPEPLALPIKQAVQPAPASESLGSANERLPESAPTEKLVTELALSSPSASAARREARPIAQTAPFTPAEPLAKPVPDEAAKAPQPGIKLDSSLASKPLPVAPTAAPEIKQISPAQHADQLYRQGLVLHTQGRESEAQAAFEEALKIDPRHLGARQALLAALVEAKHYDKAERVVQDGLALNLAPPALAMALARLQLEQGNQNAALATLDKYAAQAQDNAEYQSFQAALLQRAERHAEAVARYQAALRLQPARAVWWMGLGISLQAEKQTAEAEQAYNRARALPGLSPDLRAFVDQRLKQLH